MLASFARAQLQHWGVQVDDIPTSDAQQKKEADFLATFGGGSASICRAIIEEKTNLDGPVLLSERQKALDAGGIHATYIPLRRNETVSSVVRKAAKQLESSASTIAHDFRLIWYTATGLAAQGDYEQFMATLYGRTNILEMNAAGYRRCYYFRHADFFRRRETLDGAIAAYTDGRALHARFCLNPLSPRYASVRDSEVAKVFGAAIEDPVAAEASGSAFILDSDIDRKDERALLKYLQGKYATGPLMKFDLGYTQASIRVQDDG